MHAWLYLAACALLAAPSENGQKAPGMSGDGGAVQKAAEYEQWELEAMKNLELLENMELLENLDVVDSLDVLGLEEEK
ncbi:MAG: hypothetical protein D6806_05630 [Deltaproteobacteria bacterium]|nr:MAG: hypothetical protein D6806_05630 [Deltaproteobacteria bacterium]